MIHFKTMIQSEYKIIHFNMNIGSNITEVFSNMFNHFSTIGLYGGPAHYDVSIWQAAIEAFVTSSFKIFLTHTFPRCGATCYILPSRAMSQLFNGVNFVYRSVEHLPLFASFSQNPKLLQ